MAVRTASRNRFGRLRFSFDGQGGAAALGQRRCDDVARLEVAVVVTSSGRRYR